MKHSPRSKLWLETALLALLKKKKLSEISVTDIAQQAGVSRLTFYRNFETKERVLQSHFDRVFEEYLQTLPEQNIDIRHAVFQCFAYWNELRDEIKVLVNNELTILMYAPFERYLRNVLRKSQLEHKYNSSQITFIIGGLFSSMLELSTSSCKKTPEEISESIIELLHVGEATC